MARKRKNSRRGRGEGSISQRPDGTYYAQVSLGVDPVSGKRRRTTVSGASKQEVQEKLIKLQGDAIEGRLAGTEQVLANTLDFWLGAIKHTLAPATYKRYEHSVRKHVAPYL